MENDDGHRQYWLEPNATNLRLPNWNTDTCAHDSCSCSYIRLKPDPNRCSYFKLKLNADSCPDFSPYAYSYVEPEPYAYPYLESNPNALSNAKFNANAGARD